MCNQSIHWYMLWHSLPYKSRAYYFLQFAGVLHGSTICRSAGIIYSLHVHKLSCEFKVKVRKEKSKEKKQGLTIPGEIWYCMMHLFYNLCVYKLVMVRKVKGKDKEKGLFFLCNRSAGINLQFACTQAILKKSKFSKEKR